MALPRPIYLPTDESSLFEGYDLKLTKEGESEPFISHSLFFGSLDIPGDALAAGDIINLEIKGYVMGYEPTVHTISIPVKVSSLEPAPVPEAVIPADVQEGAELSITVSAAEGAWYTVTVYQGEEIKLQWNQDDQQPFTGELPVGVYQAKLVYGMEGYEEGQLDDTVITVHHAYAPVFTWNTEGDEVTCAATVVCAVCEDEPEDAQLTPVVTEEVILEASCATEGQKKYTATVEYNGETYSDSITLPIASGHIWNEPVYTWSESNDAVEAVRTCQRDETHFEAESVFASLVLTASPTQDTAGVCEYVSDAFVNEAFTIQRKVAREIPALKDMNVLKLPTGLREIEEEAFSGISAQAVIIPDGCVSIGAEAFANCENLLYVLIPSSVTEIAGNAFSGCPNVIIDQK